MAKHAEEIKPTGPPPRTEIITETPITSFDARKGYKAYDADPNFVRPDDSNLKYDTTKRLRCESILLFGSAAREEAREDSDVGLLIVALCLPDIKSRHEILSTSKPARIEDIWIILEELDKMVDAKTGFVVDALLEGKVMRLQWHDTGDREKTGGAAQAAGS